MSYHKCVFQCRNYLAGRMCSTELYLTHVFTLDVRERSSVPVDAVVEEHIMQQKKVSSFTSYVRVIFQRPSCIIINCSTSHVNRLLAYCERD